PPGRPAAPWRPRDRHPGDRADPHRPGRARPRRWPRLLRADRLQLSHPRRVLQGGCPRRGQQARRLMSDEEPLPTGCPVSLGLHRRLFSFWSEERVGSRGGGRGWAFCPRIRNVTVGWERSDMSLRSARIEDGYLSTEGTRSSTSVSDRRAWPVDEHA